MLSLFSYLIIHPPLSFFFFFNDTATTEIYTLSLHDALPISSRASASRPGRRSAPRCLSTRRRRRADRKSTRLNSSHLVISYAVFCLKKKKKQKKRYISPDRRSQTRSIDALTDCHEHRAVRVR